MVNNIQPLKQDIENILKRTFELYRVEFTEKKTTYCPITRVDNKHPWTSNAYKDTFNKLIPKVESLHTDMYAIVAKILDPEKGDLLVWEKHYPYLKEFRLLNDKLKYGQGREASITIREFVILEPQAYVLDIYCCFKYKQHYEAVRFCNFIETFLKIVQDAKVRMNRLNLLSRSPS
jgi:hypothetical protein